MAGKITPRLDETQVNQIYGIVNGSFKQMTGTDDIAVVDTKSLVALGQKLENTGKYDIWLNTLSRRIGMTIDTYRVYHNKYSALNRTEFEFGARVQKIEVDMPEAVEDVTYDVGKLDGQSVDQWIISNPKVHQKFFDKETPYSFFITMQKKFLKEAFLSESTMMSLVNHIFGKVQNKIDFTLEELARLCVVNFIANMAPFQEIHLGTIYNSTHPSDTVTPLSAPYNPDFLRFAIGMINNISRKLESMSTLYNADKRQKFTPKEAQRLYLLSDFITQVETVVQYAAFHENYVSKKPDIAIPYWQANTSINDSSAGFEKVSEFSATIEGGKTVNKKFLIGILFDDLAMGTFRREDDVETTTLNARARYYNTFWFEKQLWYNDMSENAVAFYLD